MRRDALLHAAIIMFFTGAAILSFYLFGAAISTRQAEMQDRYQEEYRVINHDR